MDPLKEFKEAQKLSWANFAAFEIQTTPPAARLLKHAGVKSGQRLLDVACGTGVVAITAARKGARVTGIDLTPELLERARENAEMAEVDVEWHQGDAEELPFDSGSFDVVVSQFGHIFAPRPSVVTAEMLRVLKPGGTIAFSTWPPEHGMGRMQSMAARYLPPPPPGVTPPSQWGDPAVIRERLGAAVKNITFDRDRMLVPCLSPRHNRLAAERFSGTFMRVVTHLSQSDPARLDESRREYEAIIAEYCDENVLRQDYLLTRAVKV